MKIDDIITLGKMGFTKEDIAKLTGTVKQPDPKPAPSPDPEESPEIKALKEEIAQLKAEKIKTAEQETPKPETVDDILAQILGGSDNE